MYKMKTKFFVLFFAAVMLAGCCGGGNTKKSECTAEKKACCKEATEKTCCSAAASAEKTCSAKKIINAQIFIKPEKVDDFLAATKELIEKSRAEEGCITYNLYQDPHDKTKFFFFEEWKNQAAIDFHFATEHFVNFGKMLEEFASAEAIITVL